MVQVAIWVFGTAFAVAAMIISVALQSQIGQFALAIVVTMFISVSAMRHFAVYRAAHTHPSLQAAVMVRYMGMLWSWASMTLVTIYLFLLSWDGWLPAFILLTTGGALCLFLASILDRDALETEIDPKVTRLVAIIARIQFAATCIAVGGLLAFGRFSAYARSDDASWAAFNILLTTAFGLAVLSGYYLAFVGTEPRTSDEVSPVATPRLKRAKPAGFGGQRPLRKAKPEGATRLRTA